MDRWVNKILTGDCLEVMKDMPDGCVDLVLTDPPYNVSKNYGESHSDNLSNYKEWCESWLSEARRISKGCVVFTPGIVNVGMWHEICQPNWILCWLKLAAMCRSPLGFNNWEPILLYGNPKTNKGTDVITAPIVTMEDVSGHPCPKPLKWASKILALFTDKQSIVLDPFLGSGTVAIAAVKGGRQWIGIELNPEYVAMAEARIKRETAQMRLIPA